MLDMLQNVPDDLTPEECSSHDTTLHHDTDSM